MPCWYPGAARGPVNGTDRGVDEHSRLEGAMVFVISVQNYRLYANLSGGERVVTVAVSGSARVDVRPNAGTAILSQTVNTPGGVLAVRVPAQHFIEIDGPASGAQVEIHGTA
jgi:hypothetical protein